jgi:hypothetical protein
VILAAKRTVLFVGEGADEDALLHHARELYNSRGCGTTVKIRNAYGKGPENILRCALRAEGTFDKKAILLDVDVPWDSAVIAQAHRARIQMIGSDPCLEGLILRALGQSVPRSTAACKAALKPYFPKGISDRRTLEARLSRELLDSARGQIAALDQLLRLLEGR